MDVVVKWPGSVHDERIFQNFSVSPCAKRFVPNRDPISFLLLEDSADSPLPYVMKKFSGGLEKR